jgi:hypothetical protein
VASPSENGGVTVSNGAAAGNGGAAASGLPRACIIGAGSSGIAAA